MSVNPKTAVGPLGGVRAGARRLRGWRWNGRGGLVSRPVRCRREDWYIVRARPVDAASGAPTTLLVTFYQDDRPLERRRLRLHAADTATGVELLGWLETPARATHLQVAVPDAEIGGRLREVVFHDVAERDPKCHPLANVPRWSTYRPPFTIDRVVLPAPLAALARAVPELTARVVGQPATRDELFRAARGAACVLDPRWVRRLRMSWRDVEALAAAAWLLVDLETAAGLLTACGAGEIRLVSHASAHGIMSARVEYADVPTRGLALQDVVPYAACDDRGRFRVRGLRAGRAWRRLADQAGWATLLSGETPWETEHGDVLSAMRVVGGGEMIVTDLPWLAAGLHGPLPAPRIAAHLLRMHLAAPLADPVQYWNRWATGDVLIRDIPDLAGRYAPLRPVRWAPVDAGRARLGLSLTMPGPDARPPLLIRTGRIDDDALHDGLPAEPMMIFMKWLAREARERTAWAQTHLAGCPVMWQFDTAGGLKYAVLFDAAHPTDGRRPQVVRLRLAGPAERAPEPADLVITIPQDEGLHGDASPAWQDALTRRLIRLIERGPTV